MFRRNKIGKKLTGVRFKFKRCPPPRQIMLRFMIFFLLKAVTFMYDHQWHDNMCYDVKSGCIDCPSTIEIATYGITGIGRAETLCDSVIVRGGVLKCCCIYSEVPILLLLSFLFFLEDYT